MSALHTRVFSGGSPPGQNLGVSQPWELFSLQQPGHSLSHLVKCRGFLLRQRLDGSSTRLSDVALRSPVPSDRLPLPPRSLSPGAAKAPLSWVPSACTAPGSCLQAESWAARPSALLSSV